jgi:hypothetical protein
MTQEFHLSVTPVGGDRFLVRTERVAAGVPLAEEQVLLPIDAWLAQTRQLMNDPLLGLLQAPASSPLLPIANSTAIAPQTLLELGHHLYTALMPDTLRDSWLIAQSVAHNQGEILRLRLGLKGLQLPRLPWEVMQTSGLSEPVMHSAGASAHPLTARTDVVFSRYQAMGVMGKITPTLQVDQPLRILMAIAAPTDQQRLNLRQEALQLQQELEATVSNNGNPGRAIQLTILEQPGRQRLTQAIEQGGYQVLHYAGHSDIGESGGALYLVNDKTGLTEPLSGDDLAGLLANNGVYMAVLNSCRGSYTAAVTGSEESDRNLAEALVDRGIPAVLAMAAMIPDEVALTLSQLFYRNLKQGYAIDLSLSRARQGLISAYSSQQLYWALPILYMNPEFDGYLVGGDRAPATDSLLALPVYDTPIDWVDDDALLEESASEEPLQEEDPTVVASLIQQLSSYPIASTPLATNSLQDSPLEELDEDWLNWAWKTPDIAVGEAGGAIAAITTEPDREQADSAAIALLDPPQLPPVELIGERVVSSSNQQALWMGGLLGAGAISLLGMLLFVIGQVWQEQSSPLPAAPQSTPANTIPTDWSAPETAEVTALAIAQFKRNDWTVGQRAVEELLDRGALPEAETALAAVPTPQLGDPAISFLRGRLAWESLKQGNQTYSYDDVRRFWEMAVQGQPNSSLYQTALGFAYYAEGRYQAAIQPFCQSIARATQSPLPELEQPTALTQCLPVQPPTDRHALNAHAGAALLMAKFATDANPPTPALLSQAIAVQTTVLTHDPIAYEVQALSKDWLWNAEAIQDWNQLMQLQP